MKNFLFCMISACMFMVAGNAFAGKINVGELTEMGEDVINSECAQQISAQAGDVGNAWNSMRSGCAQLRSCKKTCRQAKRSAKSGVRAEKRDCKAECKGKKGKAKRSCNKSCRQAARSGRKDARQAKRNCANDCRAQFKNAACRSARQAFWKSIMNTVKKAGPACAQQAQEFFAK